MDTKSQINAEIRPQQRVQACGSGTTTSRFIILLVVNGRGKVSIVRYLLIDHSNSTGQDGRIQSILEGGTRLVRAKQDDGEWRVWGFSNTCEFLGRVGPDNNPRDVEVLCQKIQALRPDGGTYPEQAIHKAMEETDGQGYAVSIVGLSDGEYSDTPHMLDIIKPELDRRGIPFISVLCDNGDVTTAERMAEGGGKVYFFNRKDELIRDLGESLDASSGSPFTHTRLTLERAQNFRLVRWALIQPAVREFDPRSGTADIGALESKTVIGIEVEHDRLPHPGEIKLADVLLSCRDVRTGRTESVCLGPLTAKFSAEPSAEDEMVRNSLALLEEARLADEMAASSGPRQAELALRLSRVIESNPLSDRREEKLSDLKQVENSARSGRSSAKTVAKARTSSKRSIII